MIGLVIYVDDLLITGNDYEEIKKIKHMIDTKFPIKDLGNAKFFLGLEIVQNDLGIYVNQRKYILDLLHDSGLMGCKPTNTPMIKGIKFEDENQDILCDPSKYRRVIGRLLYLNYTRPDIAYVVQQLSQFMQKPLLCHWNAALYLVKYLKGTTSLGLFYPYENDSSIIAYSDSDWGSCVETRKSITGYCICFGKSVISWKAKKQATISRSSAESEYRSLAATVCELQWISYILNDLNFKLQLPISLYCDNKAAIHISENPVFHERTKHIDIDCHVVRNQYLAGFIQLFHVQTKKQVADIFTKALDFAQFQELRSHLFLQDIHLKGGVLR
ncbi:uncharacterized mitochondrial protein AtMg00810-like [Impatiens glandulifera]|uniref:uncharacterized mitochondrial protein AtMg00810-like n=1 Tax=Impatiens glandulifera TaxID=253017 RepID=UPI001FB04F1B|nr:uncharacterized mitochondrial protein AtMg00810-like [Impatiens glandulifera]